MRRRNVVLLVGSAVIAWPLNAPAQAEKRLIGYLAAGSRVPPYIAAFQRGLAETGFVEGENLTVDYRFAEGIYERENELAAELVRRQVEVIATAGGPKVALAAKNASPTIPIVFQIGIDPVSSGLVASWAKPGGNLTGITIIAIELIAKRMELLTALFPNSGTVAALINPALGVKGPELEISTTEHAAQANGVSLRVVRASNEIELEDVFEDLARIGPRVLLLSADPFYTSRRARIVALAARYSIPAMYPQREFTEAGGLISYGASFSDQNRLAGIHVGRILRGEKPADLPVMQPTRFELVINLKTAKSLGLIVPQWLLARADEVIE